VEPDYLPDSEVCFSRAWTPFPNGGGVGGISPPQLSPGGPGGDRGGGDNFCSHPPPPPPPLAGDSGAVPPEVKFWEKLPCKIL
jgi:hypothetical protein